MTRAFRDFSVRRKLMTVVTVTSSTAVIVACTALFAYDIYTTRERLMTETRVLSDVIGSNCAAPLIFNDARAAEEALAALRHTRNVDEADVFARNGARFAGYRRPGPQRPSGSDLGGAHGYDDPQRLTFSRDIIFDGEPVGRLRIVASLRDVTSRFYHYALVVGVVLLVALIAAFVLSSKLQRLITGPILRLADAARIVSIDRRYSVRVQKDGGDEVGVLTDAFNGMLAQIETRDAHLQNARDEVQQRVDELQAAIAERRKTEAALDRSEQQLRQSQKMEAVGRLAGGVAHDFNNLLTAIGGYGDLALERDDLAAETRSHIEEMKRAADRAASLTKQLLAFSRKQILAPTILDLNTVVAGTEKMLRRMIGEDIELVAVERPDVGRVKADVGQVEQVIMNLAVNARDAMPNGGRLTIETTNVDLDASYCGPIPELAPGPYVMLAITDTGHGMTKEVQAQIFEPFFTTKEQGKGTGLGLSTVYGIVRQSKGHIAVYSEPGHGTTFKVFFPRVDEPATAAAAPSAGGTITGAETILLVEDEAQVRALALTALRQSGYHVLEARDGPHALEVSDQCASPIDILVTDMIMPRIDGRTLHERLAASRPDLRVLFMSGYADSAIVQHGELREGTAFIQKPFRPRDFVAKVREVLDAGHQNDPLRCPQPG